MKLRISTPEKIHTHPFENYRGAAAHVHPDSEKICDVFEKEHVWCRCSDVDGHGYDICGIYYHSVGY